jgi:hypothetical protein
MEPLITEEGVLCLPCHLKGERVLASHFCPICMEGYYCAACVVVHNAFLPTAEHARPKLARAANA